VAEPEGTYRIAAFSNSCRPFLARTSKRFGSRDAGFTEIQAVESRNPLIVNDSRSEKQEENRKLRLFFSCYPPVSVLFLQCRQRKKAQSAKGTPRAEDTPARSGEAKS